MSMLRLIEVNYWAVLVAGVATFVLGAVWYTVLFGAKRAALLNFSQEQIKQAEAAAPITFSTLFACYLVTAMAVAILFLGLGVESAAQGVQWCFLLWFGFAAATGLTGNITTAVPLGVFLIDAGYQLVFLGMMGGIIGAWR